MPRMDAEELKKRYEELKKTNPELIEWFTRIHGYNPLERLERRRKRPEFLTIRANEEVVVRVLSDKPRTFTNRFGRETGVLDVDVNGEERALLLGHTDLDEQLWFLLLEYGSLRGLVLRIKNLGQEPGRRKFRYEVEVLGHQPPAEEIGRPAAQLEKTPQPEAQQATQRPARQQPGVHPLLSAVSSGGGARESGASKIPEDVVADVQRYVKIFGEVPLSDFEKYLRERGIHYPLGDIMLACGLEMTKTGIRLKRSETEAGA